MNPKQLIETEEEIRNLWEDGELPYLIHLAGSMDGSYERWICDFFNANVKPTDWILASHRCHYHWLLHHEGNRYFGRGLGEVVGERPKITLSEREELIERIKDGKSMFLYGPRFICSAIVAGTASIAAGLALSIQRRGGSERVFCFAGDGAAFHGHFMESVAMAHARKLPITYIIEDNDSSCGVTKEQRGSPTDWQWPDCVVTVKYQSRFPHAGSFVRPILKTK